MKQLARRYVYWNNIDKEIEREVRACPGCVKTQTNTPKAPLHPWQEPDKCWQRIHADFAGPYLEFQYLIVVDAKPKWLKVKIFNQSPTSASTIEALRDIFAFHGFLEGLVSDNAKIFTSDEFGLFCRNSGIFRKFSAPGHPATNGLAERNVGTLKKRLAAMENDEPSTIKQKVREILFRYRATPLNDGSGKSPAELYLHRPIRIELDAIRPIKVQRSTLKPAWRSLNVGDRVQARYYHNNKAQWSLGTVLKKLGTLHYWVKVDDGYTFKRHINQLRRCDIAQDQDVKKKTVTFKEIANDDPSMGIKQQIIPPELLPELLVTPPVQQPLEEPRPLQPEGPVAEPPPIRRSNRPHRPPVYLRDYCCGE